MSATSAFANNSKETSIETSLQNTSIVENSQTSEIDEATEGNGGVIVIIDDGKDTTIIIIIVRK